MASETRGNVCEEFIKKRIQYKSQQKIFPFSFFFAQGSKKDSQQKFEQIIYLLFKKKNSTESSQFVDGVEKTPGCVFFHSTTHRKEKFVFIRIRSKKENKIC